MTDTTRETLTALAEVLRHAANKRSEYDNTRITERDIANDLATELAAPDASRKFDGAGGYDE